MKELGYHSISAFIRDAILDEKLTVEICQDPVKYDYSHSIKQLITAIPTLDGRLQHPRSGSCTHPPPRLQCKTYRRGTRQQVGISDQAAWRVAREVNLTKIKIFLKIEKHVFGNIYSL